MFSNAGIKPSDSSIKISIFREITAVEVKTIVLEKPVKKDPPLRTFNTFKISEKFYNPQPSGASIEAN